MSRHSFSTTVACSLVIRRAPARIAHIPRACPPNSKSVGRVALVGSPIRKSPFTTNRGLETEKSQLTSVKRALRFGTEQVTDLPLEEPGGAGKWTTSRTSVSPIQTAQAEDKASGELDSRITPLWSRTKAGTWSLQPEVLPIPPVAAGAEANPKDILYILGLDAKSRLLASELKPLFDSVKLIHPTGGTLQEIEYRGIHDDYRKAQDVDNTKSTEDASHPVDDPIRNIILSGSPVDSVKRMIQLRHRIDSKTAVCLMHDGLGIAETMNEMVFADGGEKPEYVLGQFNRTKHIQSAGQLVSSFGSEAPKSANVLSSVESKHFNTMLLPIDPATGEPPKGGTPAVDDLVEKFKGSRVLQAKRPPLDKWIHVKLQYMVFYTVVDPVCAVLNMRYNQIMQNRHAMALVDKLLDEVQLIASSLPEFYKSFYRSGGEDDGGAVQSHYLKRLIEQDVLKKVCFAKLRRMGSQVDRLTKQIQGGRSMDIGYFNGYFIRRAKSRGLPCYYNEMMVDMLKAKHKMRWEEIHNAIPFEVTSASWWRGYKPRGYVA